ncbi:unnamed protein product, partial [Coregonus sp. 'balchen']
PREHRFPPTNQRTQSQEDDDDDEEKFEDEEEEAEQERQKMQIGEQANTAGGESSTGGSHGVVKKYVFKVTCGAINGMLHKDRFASGLCGKSIRTKKRWVTPVEFSGVLGIHSVQCPCKLCSTTTKDVECHYLLLYLYHEDKDSIFVKDPCINVRNYTSMIKTPMWLDRVVEKLQENLYQSVQHFESDVLLIFTNCATFN